MSDDLSLNHNMTSGVDCPIMVMLVDDQAIVSEAVRRLLARQPDIDLHYCPNPQEAVAQAVQIKPTVILLDLIMPQLDGIEVTNRLRANPITAGIPIVVLSTTEDPVVKSQAFSIGADDYLVKLPDKIELIARIRYHSKSYLNAVQRDEAYRALRESQQQLLDSNTALTSLNQAFQEAKEEAERANRAKSDFLSRMSHELRTPLNAILGFSQVLEMEKLTTRQKESVEHILKAGTHLLSLINEMLDIARVEAGRISLSIEPILISSIVSEAVELIRPLTADLNIVIEDSVSQGCDYHVYADRQRLKQVIINLLSNAIKYNRPNGAIRINYEIDLPNQLRINVTDSGYGIAENDIKRLFIPFERLHREQSTTEGTGLGLALSKRLMEAMGGLLGASSIPDEGSTFYFRLPIASDPLEAVEEQVEVDEPTPVDTEAEIPDSDKKVVLLVEDNISNFRLIETVLANRPHLSLLSAMQGRVGLELIESRRPDLILLDLHLPDISGHEMLSRIKNSPRTRDIPVIIVSADATQSQIDRALSSGASAYLTKPLNIREFLRQLDSLLRKGARK